MNGRIYSEFEQKFIEPESHEFKLRYLLIPILLAIVVLGIFKPLWVAWGFVYGYTVVLGCFLTFMILFNTIGVICLMFGKNVYENSPHEPVLEPGFSRELDTISDDLCPYFKEH
jgi:hypothetical protein